MHMAYPILRPGRGEDTVAGQIMAHVVARTWHAGGASRINHQSHVARGRRGGVKIARSWPAAGGWGSRAWGGERAGCGPGTGCAGARAGGKIGRGRPLTSLILGGLDPVHQSDRRELL